MRGSIALFVTAMLAMDLMNRLNWPLYALKVVKVVISKLPLLSIAIFPYVGTELLVVGFALVAGLSRIVCRKCLDYDQIYYVIWFVRVSKPNVNAFVCASSNIIFMLLLFFFCFWICTTKYHKLRPIAIST